MEATQRNKAQSHSFRLNTTEDPTDEQLNFIMRQVGKAARASSLQVEAEIRQRMQVLHEQIAEAKRIGYSK